ncbi:DUF1833 family protein [Chromobacterium haemolyticum]|uniref:DUF1833 domain-containing protein n=1 Tax=Chromobacterium haemolyticum TaxID=394935 RepID=A0A1W0CCX7_9NEIS|nr:DUF1833 family protein [Chromobacterium haemolyticum]OQS32597.1 hypothetical protein B0T45_21585 [Chromobacterium haemolyticum]
MTRRYSQAAREAMNATAADDVMLVLLEIRHPQLALPVRLVNDVQNIVVEGNEFIACAFDVTLPDDTDNRLPSAKLEIDNIGRELTQWLEISGGGTGATCRILQVMRSTPQLVEFDMTMDLSGLSMDHVKVSGTLGFADTLNQPAVTVYYRPETAPALF